MITYKQLLESGHMADLSGIYNPYAFQWEKGEHIDVYYPVDFNCIGLCVYKFPLGECTNGGVTGGDVKDVYLPTVEGNLSAFKLGEEQKLILFPEQKSKDYWALKDVQVQPGMIGPMSGGNLAYSSDSRCRQVYHIHDRFETPETNRALSI